MMKSYRARNGQLERLAHGEDPSQALWIDLYNPQEDEISTLRSLGVDVPSLADMEEIEISNRLYHEKDADYMTVVLPGLSQTANPVAGPVAFILTRNRLITVRHHAPRPFDTFPERANRAVLGCSSAERILLGLCEECISRLADLLEGTGRSLDEIAGEIFATGQTLGAEKLSGSLQRIGREGELLGRIRLGLLTLERMLGYFSQTVPTRHETDALRPAVKALGRDLQALAEHADFLTSRIGLATDATLGMINLSQNATVRIVSVVAALFLPPTLIASIYGMNFAHMPELAAPWGYPVALVLMAGSAFLTWLYFKWRRWL